MTGASPILDLVRWTVGGLLIGAGVLCVLGNFVGVVYAMIRKSSFSMIPLIGGIALCAGILIVPPSSIAARAPYAAIALLLDPSFISLICLPFYLVLRRGRTGSTE